MKLVVFVSDQVNLLCTESGTNKSKERKRERKRENFLVCIVGRGKGNS
jgi:hypothetical protein